MKYIYIAVFVSCAAIGYLMYRKNKKILKHEAYLSMANSTPVVSSPNEMIVMPMELLPEEAEINENNLVEIKDKKVIARIENLVPGTAGALQNAAAAKKINDVIKEGGQLYQAIIPQGAVLDKSREIADALRGTFREAGNPIKGHANFKPVDGAVAASTAANVANAVMNVGSMVVGQYYMAQISAELDAISDGIEKISNFQDDEYKAKVYSLIGQIQKISNFQVETIENDDVRSRSLINLQQLENECTVLLGQANIALSKYTNKNNLTYEEYERLIKEANNWYQCQQALTEALYKIGDLTYTLNLGQLSREHCYAMYPTYLKQTNESLNRLNNWHTSNGERLGIDVNDYIRKRAGLDKAVHWLPSLFDESKAFRSIPVETAHIIKGQQQYHYSNIDDSKLFESDVRIIAKEGKLYYLPESIDKRSEEE